MKLVYLPLNFVMPLQIKKINSLVVEHPHLYADMLMAICQQMSKECEQWDLLDDDTEFQLDKKCELLLSPADLHFHKKDLQKELLLEVGREIECSENMEQLLSLHGEFVQMIGEIFEQYRYPLEYDFEFCLKEYLKQYQVMLENPDGSVLEKLLEYIPTVQGLTGKTIFLLHGFDDYLTKEDFMHLQKWIAYQEVYIIFLGSRQLKLKEYVNEYIIDIDLCEIH